MGYETLEILRSYKTYKNDIVNEFYIPVLKESILYKRAVGFFSSTALIELSKGLASMIKNNGKIRFIVSPLLQEDDINAIKRGYKEREIITRAMEREFYEPKNKSDEERLNWLAYLIARGSLEIKVAFTPINKSNGMYHEKIGIVNDANGNYLAFTGSMNETINAFHNNYESIVVFNSLVDSDAIRVKDLDIEFDLLWSGREEDITVIDFPKVLIKRLMAYKKAILNLELDNQEMEPKWTEQGEYPRLPENLELHSYQIEAINNWVENDYCGIFDMATGTGKTLTGLGAAARLYKDKQRCAIIIVCPYQHLVDQWVEDVLKFNISPIIGYSTSKQRDWKKRLENDIIDFNLRIINTFSFITTNATFASEYIQGKLRELGEDTLLIIDEAHNFGAYSLSKSLSNRVQYRLALSATLERHRDDEGTQTLYRYFGKRCIEYGLERAIREGKLTPYYYHPVVVYLSPDELDKYKELTIKISRQHRITNEGISEISELGKKLLIERARIVAGAASKINALKEIMLQYREESHILVYCGAASSYNSNLDSSDEDEEGERQIVSVSKMLGLELGMKVAHFTSAETAEEREKIKEQFATADPYQVLVAIKCLDEGVNIPSIRTAFILASSTNPKEYIQRRGRVLRKAPNKPYAVIYDFITLPTPLANVSYSSELAQMDLSLVKRELLRMREFGEISKNPSEADILANELVEAYGLDLTNEGEKSYE